MRISIKLRKRIKNFLIGLVYILIFSGIIGYFSYLVVLRYYSPHVDRSDSIYIRTDDDFLKYSFPGMGTESDPYIIENYIILTLAEFAIYIHGVSKYVIIRNNFLHSDESAIQISSAGSNTIKLINNTCVGSCYSHLWWSMGIGIYNTDGCYICNNTCLNLYKGISLGSCDNCIIINNHLKNNCNCCNIVREGISLMNSENITINNSTFYNNHAGVKVSYSNGINILNNTFTNNIYGIYLLDSNCTYNQNYFYNNTYDVYTS